MKRNNKVYQMKINISKAAIIGLYFTFCGIANAGLIHNNNEYLDLGETTGLSELALNSLLSQGGYEGYAIASRTKATELFTEFHSVVQGTFSGNGWYGFQHLTTGFGFEMSQWLRGGPVNAVNGNVNSVNGQGAIYINRKYSKHVLFGNDLSGQYDSGFVNLYDAVNAGNANAAYSISGTNVGTSNGSSAPSKGSVWVVSRSLAVPEPSTLAIFALGMIGLASRRFKKQT
jgi:hypothetical protein